MDCIDYGFPQGILDVRPMTLSAGGMEIAKFAAGDIQYIFSNCETVEGEMYWIGVMKALYRISREGR